MESAELVRVDLTRSLGVLVSICFLGEAWRHLLACIVANPRDGEGSHIN